MLEVQFIMLRQRGESVLPLLIGVLLSAGDTDRVEPATQSQPHSGVLLVKTLDVGCPFFVSKTHRGGSEKRAAPRAAEVAGSRTLAPFAQGVQHQRNRDQNGGKESDRNGQQEQRGGLPGPPPPPPAPGARTLYGSARFQATSVAPEPGSLWNSAGRSPPGIV